MRTIKLIKIDGQEPVLKLPNTHTHTCMANKTEEKYNSKRKRNYVFPSYPICSCLQSDMVAPFTTPKTFIHKAISKQKDFNKGMSSKEYNSICAYSRILAHLL
jgi:hypothetical protein